MADDRNRSKSVAIVGGGLVGALNACFLAKRGFKVDVFEARSDIRTQEVVRGRSINLALSRRGRDALRAVGLEDEIVSKGIPMFARMIHELDWSRHPIPYGTKDQYIMSVDRRKLNELLLSAAEKYGNVKLHFEHKFVSADCKTGEMVLQKADGEQVRRKSDLIIGNDGAFSSVRRQLMKQTRFDYSQEYIPHGYMELCIPSKDGKFNMETNYLHIWPRNEFMMIALPNSEDKSFVVTLFMPFGMFESITTPRSLLDFFHEHFPDSVPLIGERALVDIFFESKPLPMVSVKCSPYHFEDKVLIMGDAAHAMVPFYGQGMNCGFEDCIVLDQLLDSCRDDFRETLKEYTNVRRPDNHTICDLAMYNYIEMRHLVNSRLFLLRKKLDNFLYRLMPNTWVPLYTMVSFTRIRYHEAWERRQWQNKVLTRVLRGAGVGVAAASAVLVAVFVRDGGADKLLRFVSEMAETLTQKLK